LLSVVCAAALDAAPCSTQGCDNAGTNSSAPQTSCLQGVLDNCYSSNGAAGGEVVLEAGVYHTGSLVVPSNITLRLAAGASLLGSVDPHEYPLVPPLPSYGAPRGTMYCAPPAPPSPHLLTRTPSLSHTHTSHTHAHMQHARAHTHASSLSHYPHALALALTLACTHTLLADCCCNDWLKHNCSNVPGHPPTYTQRHRALLTTAAGAVNVAIIGAGADHSVIDGQGWPWWIKFESGGLYAGRHVHAFC
jgi:hypothetical protein